MEIPEVLRSERARLRAGLHDARLRMQRMGSFHPARIALEIEMQKILQRLDEVEQIITPLRPKVAFSFKSHDPTVTAAGFADGHLVEPDALPISIAALAEDLPGRTPVVETVVAHTILPQSASGPDPSEPRLPPPSSRARQALSGIAARLGVEYRDLGVLLIAFAVFLTGEVRNMIYAILRPFYLVGRFSVRAGHALLVSVSRALGVSRRGFASLASSASRVGRIIAARTDKALDGGLNATGAAAGRLGSSATRAVSAIGGVAIGTGRAFAGRLSRSIPALHARSRRVASWSIRHGGTLYGHGARTLHNVAKQANATGRRTIAALSRRFAALARGASGATVSTGRAVRGVIRHASTLVKENTGDILIRLLLSAAYTAPAGAAVSRFVSRSLRSIANYIQVRLAHAAPLILSSTRSLLRRLARLAVMLAERAKTAWFAGARWTSEAFSRLALDAGYWFLVLASYAVPAIKDVAGSSRRIFRASRQRASKEAARAAVAISDGSAWLRRRGVPILKHASGRTVGALRSGLTFASGATKTAIARVSAGSTSLARRFELDRRTIALLSASRAARNHAVPALLYGFSRTSRVAMIASARSGAVFASLVGRLELARHKTPLLAASRRVHARIAAISHDRLRQVARVTGAGFRYVFNLLFIKALPRQGDDLPTPGANSPDLY